jgi:hypothetical protein
MPFQYRSSKRTFGSKRLNPVADILHVAMAAARL